MNIELVLAGIYTFLSLFRWISKYDIDVFIVLVGQILCLIIVWKWVLER